MTQKTELKQKWMEGYEVVLGDEVEEKKESEFSMLLSKTKEMNFHEGEVFNGRIISIGQDYIMVDIGYKQEGLIPVKEFQHYDGTLKVKEGTFTGGNRTLISAAIPMQSRK